MQHRTVQDAMTHQVTSAGADCSFKELVVLLADSDTSAVNVHDLMVVDGDDAPALPEPAAAMPVTP